MKITKDNVFLAKIVSFDIHSLLFEINNLTPSTEEYRLVAVYGKTAYDLQTTEKYTVLNVTQGIIDNEDLNIIKNNRKYVYSKCPLIEMWEDLKNVYGVDESLDNFLNHSIKDIEYLNNIFTGRTKVIDLKKIRKIKGK